MVEVWENIDGYDNYQVSNFGNIRNKKTNRILNKKIRKERLF